MKYLCLIILFVIVQSCGTSAYRKNYVISQFQQEKINEEQACDEF